MRVTTMNALLAEHVATPKFRAWLLSLFGVVALCLAMAGVYGVMAYRRRAAIERNRRPDGAGRERAERVVADARTRIEAGSHGPRRRRRRRLASARLVSGMLFEVRPYDVVTYTGVVLGLGLLSLLATYLPARRATRVDPLLVLRQE